VVGGYLREGERPSRALILDVAMEFEIRVVAMNRGLLVENTCHGSGMEGKGSSWLLATNSFFCDMDPRYRKMKAKSQPESKNHASDCD
jgi:hypothetical protein